MQMTSVDLNCDLGESFGCYTLGHDDELMASLTSASVACGFHAGDPHVMRRTVASALQHGVRIGAHPGLPDLLGFGRRRMAVTAEELYDLFLYQIGALRAFVEASGQRLQHVKPHGALFEMALTDDKLAQAMYRAARDAGPDLIWLAPAGAVVDQARHFGLRAAAEFYADRAYHPDSRLVSRRISGAVVQDTVQVRIRLMQALQCGTVTTLEGETIPLRFDSICVHGDTPGAVDIVRTVRMACDEMGVRVKSFAETPP